MSDKKTVLEIGCLYAKEDKKLLIGMHKDDLARAIKGNPVSIPLGPVKKFLSGQGDEGTWDRLETLEYCSMEKFDTVRKSLLLESIFSGDKNLRDMFKEFTEFLKAKKDLADEK
jgi:hypothetical protein